MKKFRFIIDEKHTIWLRSFIEIEAENQKEALNKLEVVELDWEYLYDTLETMTKEDNLGNPTIEIYEDLTDEPIKTN